MIDALIRAGLVYRCSGRIALCDPEIKQLSLSLFD